MHLNPAQTLADVVKVSLNIPHRKLQKFLFCHVFGIWLINSTYRMMNHQKARIFTGLPVFASWRSHNSTKAVKLLSTGSICLLVVVS